MAYVLKSTGIAANCTMCIAVDPDTGTIKDFASSSVTADLLVGANVTFGSQSWDGNTRHFWTPASGTTDADVVKFGTTKPAWSNNVNGMARTWVFIGEVAGASARVFGKDSSHYAAARSGLGGDTYPHVQGLGYAASANGGNAPLSAGNKAIFGESTVHGTSGIFYSALHDASSMTVNSVAAPGSTSASNNYSLTYVNRRDDNTTKQLDKTHAILIFDIALSEAEWDSLRDDWFAVLLEADGGDPEGAGSAAGVATVAGVGASNRAAAGASAGVATASGVSGGALTVGPLKNNSGQILADETGMTVFFNDVDTNALVDTLADQVTDGSGMASLDMAGLDPATDYRMVLVMADGAEGMATITTP